MTKKLLSLVLMMSLIITFAPVLSVLSAQNDYVFSSPATSNYLYYHADGENRMSDFFEYTNLGSSVTATWTSLEGETSSVFRLFQSGTESGRVSQALKANIPDRSEFTYSYSFKLVSMSANSALMLPSDSYSETTLLTVKGNSLCSGSSKISTLTVGEWYKVRLVKNDKNKQIVIFDSNGKKVADYSFKGNTTTASKIHFGFLAASQSGAEVIFDDFKIYTTNENNDETTLVPRYFSVFCNIGEDEYTIKSLLGTNCVFTGDIYFYANGAKRLYSDYKVTPIRENKKVYLPPMFFASALGYDYSAGKINGTDVSVCLKNIDGLNLIDTAEASKLLGLYVYEDERGFVVAGSTQCTLENSDSPFEIQESADGVYRYLYFDRADAGEILRLSSQSRPRILTNEASLIKTLEYIDTDTTVKSWRRDVINSADSLMGKEGVAYEIIGTRLLSAAREVLSRVVIYSSAYLLTKDIKYADAGISEMINACSWQDWNANKHYLDNSELCYAIAIGFDSFYDVLTDEQKEYIMKKTVEYSLVNSVHAYEGTFKIGSEWRYANGNWGVVCPGGMTSALISFSGEDYALPFETQKYLLSNAMHSVEYPAMLFYPDGSWSEGPGYWDYTIKYFAGAFLGSIYFATGDTWGFLRPEGVSECLNGYVYLTSESSGTFNFADSASGFSSAPVGFLIAKMTNDLSAMAEWKNMYSLATSQGNAYGIMWYEPVESTGIQLPKDVWLRSAGAGVMREKWGDSKATYVGIKGGQNYTNHDNLDLGNFIFDALGERWAMELGADNYNIEGGYWGLNAYTLYVKRPEGQNCLVINPEKGDTAGAYYQQKLDTFAEVSSFETKPKGAYMSLDLTDANSRDVTNYQRGYFYGDNRKTLVVQDELSLKEDNSNLYWSMHTEAEIEIDQNQKGATLKFGYKKLRVTLDTNADLCFTATEAVALPGSVVRPGENSRANINKLLLSGMGSGDVYITVKLTPHYDDLVIDECANYVPMSQWTITDGEFVEDTKFLYMGADRRIDVNSDYNFRVDFPFDAKSCSLWSESGKLYDFGAVKKGMQKLTIPANSLNLTGDCNVFLRAEDGSNIKDSILTTIHFYKSNKRSLIKTINFENCSVTSADATIKSQSGIESIIPQDDVTDFSVKQMADGNKMLCAYIKEGRTSKVPYIRKTIPTTDCGVIDFEFDFIVGAVGGAISFETRSTDRSYASFDGQSGSVSVVNRLGLLGTSDYSFVPGKTYHTIITLDALNNYFCIRVDDMIVREGLFSIKDFIYMGLNFSSVNDGGSEIYVDNLYVSARCIADDFDGNSFILGHHFDKNTPYTAVVAYYKGNKLVALDQRQGGGICVTEIFEKKNVDADTVKTIILSDKLKPYKTCCVYFK